MTLTKQIAFLHIYVMALFFIPETNTQHQPNERETGKDSIAIEWAESIEGDFSFSKEWSYPVGIYINDFGQISCDGFCPERTYGMKDRNGRILEDSLQYFYQLVDTTHQFHSIESEAWCYEYAGTNFMYCSKEGNGSYVCASARNPGTHCSLHLKITDKYCTPAIDLRSIKPGGSAKFPCKSGAIKIDRKLLESGILKAVFDFKFIPGPGDKDAIFWKGKILTEVAM